ncbi:hypothetical protein [Verrucomicrobium sp. BvORR106]|uniref:hypothetical protein n=1 Tax=Verrucomicrobium sp. BvORR106 TaxID=1403819 RepID=UPI00056F5C31|nr:hypothetical protein [Verrucomicrobium sp. BvORR106]
MNPARITANISGLAFLPQEASRQLSAGMGALEKIASCTASHLQQGGYMTDDEARELLASYRAHLSSGSAQDSPTITDFLAFAARTQSKIHELTAEGEVARMQKVLRHRLHEHVHYWSVGPLPGRPKSLYEHSPALRIACSLLGCPSVLAGETSIVHIASLNPMSAVVAADWIRHEMTAGGQADAPFIFSFIVDLPLWEGLVQRHFAS